MAAYQQVNQYLNHHYESMDPEQLILLLYNGALNRLRLTREGIKEKDVKKKGENLSKAIAIISELNASVDPEMNDESTQFLRGLYMAILTELPKIALNNDLKTLNQAETYISKLKDIWEKDVMTKKKASIPNIVKEPAGKQALPSAFNENRAKVSFRSISV
ncbi:MAG: flagellar export chaperone FliS [Desulfobacteraceae bacterium]|nr:flagellar export chaperone FliS [Desulfobacteraceae bacterium]